MLPPLNLLDLLNFGLVVLIWLVQLIIYPGLALYPVDRLLLWHARYTRLIPFFVVPLMLGQLGWLAVAAYQGGGAAVNAMLVLVLLCWAVTFKYSVALHRRITDRQDPAGAVRLLILTNWPRSVLWTVVCLIGLVTA